MQTFKVSIHRFTNMQQGGPFWVCHVVIPGELNPEVVTLDRDKVNDITPASRQVFLEHVAQIAIFQATKKTYRFHGGQIQFDDMSNGQSYVLMDAELAPDIAVEEGKYYKSIEPPTGVPTSPWQTLLDRADLDADETDGIHQDAIEMVVSMGFRSDQMPDAVGDEAGDGLQTALMEVGVRIGSQKFHKLSNLIIAAMQLASTEED